MKVLLTSAQRCIWLRRIHDSQAGSEDLPINNILRSHRRGEGNNREYESRNEDQHRDLPESICSSKVKNVQDVKETEAGAQLRGGCGQKA